MKLALAMTALAAALAVSVAPSTAAAQQKQAGSPPDSTQRDSTVRDTTAASVAERGARGQVSILREVFSYAERGRRDPMVSLVSSADVRPLVTEVEVISIIYSPGRSIATMRNLSDRRVIYRVKEGDVLGRMKIAQITPAEVVVTLEEIGASRTERLAVKPDTTARTP